MRALMYSGRGCVASMPPLTSSHPKPPSDSAAARPNSISRLASAWRHGAVPGSLMVVPSWSRARRRQLAGSARDQPDRENGLATEWRAGVLDALEEPLDGDAAEPGRILIHDRDRGRQ